MIIRNGSKIALLTKRTLQISGVCLLMIIRTLQPIGPHHARPFAARVPVIVAALQSLPSRHRQASPGNPAGRPRQREDRASQAVRPSSCSTARRIHADRDRSSASAARRTWSSSSGGKRTGTGGAKPGRVPTSRGALRLLVLRLGVELILLLRCHRHVVHRSLRYWAARPGDAFVAANRAAPARILIARRRKWDSQYSPANLAAHQPMSRQLGRVEQRITGPIRHRYRRFPDAGA